MKNILAIVGRPNVGKSTLFNRLTESRDAIVEETSGVTRDRNYGESHWNGMEFAIVDTGGYVYGSEDVFEEEIRKQVKLAIEETDVIVFLVDVVEGITPMDEDVAIMLRKTDKPVLLVSNKVDNTKRYNDSNEFYALGLGEVYSISSINGSGTGDLLDEVVKRFKEKPEEEKVSDLPKYAVVGRPNVGKSSFINALLGDERNIVTPVSGTTRDTINTPYNRFGYDFELVDTAGIRKKKKVHENIEFYSVLRAIKAIENSDVCFLMIDAQEGIEAQDVSIMRLIVKNNKGLVIIVNKWDLIEKSSNTHLEFTRKIKEKIAPFTDVPILFTSVLEKQRLFKALDAANQVIENRKRRITTSKLNEHLLPLIQAFPPPSASRERYIKIKYITQLPLAYPAFAFFCNLPNEVKDSYSRFLENKIREEYDFNGCPIRLYFRDK
ncbi:MAG: ribosome biogenesis GTPase Der [Bacteroidales bacterium]|jgi:GTP-binding protein|nr:ribosome biogenesis GTPase Der [Bacteroidales bacterium]